MQLLGGPSIGERRRVPEGESVELALPLQEGGVAKEVALGELLLTGEIDPRSESPGERGAFVQLRRAVGRL